MKRESFCNIYPTYRSTPVTMGTIEKDWDMGSPLERPRV
jgi:hypothetical protein